MIVVMIHNKSVAIDLKHAQPIKLFDQMNQNKLDFENICALALPLESRMSRTRR